MNASLDPAAAPNTTSLGEQQSSSYALPRSFFLLPWEVLIAAIVFVVSLIAYISTLAPTVLDGDAALFQYTPWALGVTYPTGYPTYILLGWLWTTLVRFGSIAYRMNLFSAVCGALALATVYLAVRRLLENRLAALLSVLIFATLPTYWRWATEAKIYTLHILLVSSILFLLTRCDKSGNQEVREAGKRGTRVLGEPGIGESGSQNIRGSTGPSNEIWGQAWFLMLAAILFGLGLGNHSTTVLLAPGLLLFFWLNCRPMRNAQYAIRSRHHIVRFSTLLLPIILLPLLLYLYVPLRAEWLLAREGTLSGLTVPVAVARGLVSDFYHSGLVGLVRYFIAADFTGGVVTNWGLVPSQIVTVYWPLVRSDFTPWGAALGLVGAVYFALWRPRRFWPLFLMYVALIPFVLTYGQGEQAAFLLASSLMLAIFGGAAIAGGLRLISSIRNKGSRTRDSAIYYLLSIFLTLALVTAVAWLAVQQAERNIDWLTNKWDDAAHQYWSDVLAHPLESGAGVLAHWGDLTTFWYLQHVDGTRPDLYGLYPPSEEVVVAWLGAGRALYIAGPLQGWAADVENRYQLLPWGRVVRLASRDADPLALLSDLPDAPNQALFSDRIRLLKVGLPTPLAKSGGTQANSGGMLPVTLAWQSMGRLPADTHVSLRLVEDDGTTAAQTDQALVSGWLPADSLPAGQVLLSYHGFKLPTGLLPGQYQLELAIFQPRVGAWPTANGQLTLDLGPVRVLPAHPSQPSDPWNEYKPLSGVDFGGEIRLLGIDYSVTRARQGTGFSAELLWQAARPPAADYELLVELVDSKGKIWRDWHHIPTDGRAPTSTWSAGQLVRDRVALVLPASAPTDRRTRCW